MGGGVSTNDKSSNGIELSRLGQDLLLPHPSTHPPNYTPSHGWGSFHRFQIFKQNWNISISSSTIEFWLIPRVPPGGRGVGGWGWGVVRYCPHTCAHTHTCTCAHVWHHREFPGIPQTSNGSSHLHEIIMFTMRACACMHAHACAHV